jgi:phage protein D
MTDTSTQTAFYASRPTIRVDGQVQVELGESGLKSLIVEETTLGLFRCEASFINKGSKGQEVDYLYFDGRVLKFGKPFSVEFGPPGVSNPVFAGRLTGFEAQYPFQREPALTVLAEDRFQDLRMQRRTRTFENVTDKDVIQQIASEHGLTAQVDVDGTTYRVLAQVNQSDLAFLRERVTAIDAQLWVDDRTLYAQARSRRKASEITLHYPQTLLEFSVLADLAHQRTTVCVSGWDVGGKQAIDVQADESAIAAELNGGRSGSTILDESLAQRTERIVSAVPLSSVEARALAEARYRQRARRFVTGMGIADGNPRIRVGTLLNLEGLGPIFDGKYFVTVARHTFDLTFGYRTTFELERAGLGG